MLCAAIKDCPVFGGTLVSFDAAKVASMKGVKHVLKVGDSAVAVVADRWWQAKTALDALPATWDEGPNAKVSSASIAEFIKSGLDAEQAFVGNENGNARQAIAGAAKKVEATYAFPYQNHATMEPMNATAVYTPDRCEVWAPTQTARRRSPPSPKPPACRSPSAMSTRCRSARLRPAHDQRLCAAGDRHRQADTRHAGEAHLVARGGYDARPIPSDHAGQDGRGFRRKQ